jgi:hypothetical protein
MSLDRARRDAEQLRGAGGIQVEEQPQGDNLPCRAGSRIRAAMVPGSTGLSDPPQTTGRSATVPGSGTDTSRRRRRHREMFAFSAVRITHAAGAGCLLTVRHDEQARAKASSTRSCAVSRSPTLIRTVRRQSSFGSAVELREVQSLGSHTYSTHDRRPRTTWLVPAACPTGLWHDPASEERGHHRGTGE